MILVVISAASAGSVLTGCAGDEGPDVLLRTPSDRPALAALDRTPVGSATTAPPARTITVSPTPTLRAGDLPSLTSPVDVSPSPTLALPPGGAPSAIAIESPSKLLSPYPVGSPPRTQPLTRAQALARCAQTVVAGLSRNERAGQVLMVGVPADQLGSADWVVSGYSVGGVFLRGRSAEPASAVRRDVAALQAVARQGGVPRLLIAADQEGGAVQTLSGPGFAELPSGRVQGAWSDSTLVSRTTASAKALAGAGVNLNMAPVADVVATSDRALNPPIGQTARDLGSNPNAVGADVRAIVTATQQAGVSTAIKHFPGLGRVRLNTDTSAAAVDTRMSAIDAHLSPFRAGVEAGSRFVMISSARYPRLDSREIAAFSRPITTDLLRHRLGFTGVAVSDDLGAAGAVAEVPVGERAVRFIGAGGDLVLTVRSEDVKVMRGALLGAARASAPYARRLDQAALRVVTAKVDAGVIGCSATGVPSS